MERVPVSLSGNDTLDKSEFRDLLKINQGITRDRGPLFDHTIRSRWGDGLRFRYQLSWTAGTDSQRTFFKPYESRDT